MEPLRNLHVIADQSCAQIIGSACVLHYEGSDDNRLHLEWIRRALDKLTAAVEAAEAALKAEREQEAA